MAIVKAQKIFLEMDRRDQQQIVLAATGEVVKDLVYRVHGRDGLSWAGINHIAYMMGDIKVEPWVKWDPIEMHGRRYWSATVRAINEKYNLASLGTAEASELMEVYDRDERGNKIPDGQGGYRQHLEPDAFCRRKALSMAQRNAKKAVIPEAVLAKWMGYFLDLKNGKKAEPPFKPKVIDADYKITPPTKNNQIKSEQEKMIKEQAKRDRKKTSKKSQVTLGRKVNLNILEYNLFKAYGIPQEALDIWEEAEYFYVAPTGELEDESQYKIDGCLKGFDAVWEEKGPHGHWRIPKEG